jgi:hypothetical protein
VPDTHAHTHDGQRQVPRDRPDIRAQLTGSFTYVDQRFIKERHGVSMTAKVRPSLPCPADCGQHAEPVAPGGSVAAGRGSTEGHYPPIALVTRHGISSSDARTTTPRQSRRDPRRAIRSLRARRKATVAAAPTKPPAIVRYRRPADRRSRPQQWADAVQTLADLLTGFRSGGTTCPPASQTARRRKHWMPCWSCAVMSKNSRRSTCQRVSDGTDGARLWRYRKVPAEKIALATSRAVHIRLLVGATAVRSKSE